MGFGGISIWQLLIILLVVLVLFGSKKLRSIGSDLGQGIKGFKKAINEDESKENDKSKD
ncbi:twin-arginine translocase TatA/TatE family subunit [Gammaproteobacteria bacterium]|nr:twin-arginine translocase TatA/TatE family subunit [Gammaproteobacteria bacterium]|tara:strand:+ start:420 stop:596 length:177 start_codon:yes stop_codon:yes gene_type:complete